MTNNPCAALAQWEISFIDLSLLPALIKHNKTFCQIGSYQILNTEIQSHICIYNYFTSLAAHFNTII